MEKVTDVGDLCVWFRFWCQLWKVTGLDDNEFESWMYDLAGVVFEMNIF